MLKFALVISYLFLGQPSKLTYYEYSGLSQCQHHITEAITEFKEYFNSSSYQFVSANCVRM